MCPGREGGVGDRRRRGLPLRLEHVHRLARCRYRCRWGMGVGTKQVQAQVQTGAVQMSVQEQVWAEERARFLSPNWTAVALSRALPLRPLPDLLCSSAGEASRGAGDQCHGPPRLPGTAWRRGNGGVHRAAVCTAPRDGGKGVPPTHPRSGSGAVDLL